MYFWNAKALAEDLKAGRLNQREELKYFLAFMVPISILLEAPFWLAEEPTPLLLIEAVTVIAITVGGILFCYQANRQGDDKEFIKRFVCLSWPITLKVTVIFLAVYIGYMITGYMIAGDQFDAFLERTNAADVAFIILSEVAYYQRIRAHLLKLGEGKNP